MLNTPQALKCYKSLVGLGPGLQELFLLKLSSSKLQPLQSTALPRHINPQGANPEVTLLAESHQTPNERLHQALAAPPLMEFLGMAGMGTGLMLSQSARSSQMLHQVIGPFLQALMRHLLPLRVLEILSVL